MVEKKERKDLLHCLIPRQLKQQMQVEASRQTVENHYKVTLSDIANQCLMHGISLVSAKRTVIKAEGAISCLGDIPCGDS